MTSLRRTVRHALTSAIMVGGLYSAPMVVATLAATPAGPTLELQDGPTSDHGSVVWMTAAEDFAETMETDEAIEVGEAEGSLDEASEGHEILAAPNGKGPKVAAGSRRGGKGKARKTRRKRRCKDPVPEIERLDDSYFRVQRRFVDGYATSIKALNTLGWVRRHKDDGGKVDGFSVHGIRCGTPLHQAGIRNGDVIKSINGKNVRTIAGAITTYARVRGKPNVKVAVTRRDKPMMLSFDLY